MHPRHYLWMSGMLIFTLMMATAFMGYVLPWGQMSFWGATVITNLFSAVPVIGKNIVEWMWGGFNVSNPTLNRFYSLHYTLPFVIAGGVIVHLALLHDVGSNNPLGIEYYGEKISFYPYFYVKDLLSIFVLLLLFSVLLYFFPNLLNHADNSIPANPLSTPAHIVPEWYFLPFYAILRAIPHKLGGVVAMGGALIALLMLPYLNISRVRSTQFRPIYALAFWVFVFNFFLLGWLGQKEMEEPFLNISFYATLYYFFFLLFVIPIVNKVEELLPLYNYEK